ncbi:MAG: hypothetical protein IJL87_00045, partial [Clostridia bacterium]|nr:hypothetical protein [Clostridia bacterium]
MLTYKDDWEEAKKHYEAFWEKDYLSRCCLAITLPRKTHKKQQIQRHEYTVEQRYTDPNALYEGMIGYCEGTEFLCECNPGQMINFGTAGECQYFGSKPHFTPETVWFAPILDEPDISRLRFDKTLFEPHKKLVTDLVKLVGNDYFVSMNDNCGIIDGLAHIRGTENLLVDMLYEPEFVLEAEKMIIDAWVETQTEYFDLIKENNFGGSSHSWMQLWCPERHLQLQCDYCCMISPQMFEKFILPELEATSSVFEHCTYHLDGIEQIRHLDMILSVKGIDNIQWTRVAGQPKTSANIESL